MTVDIDAIEQAIIDRMKADSRFDDIVAYGQGVAFPVPVGLFPLAEVVIGNELELQEQTGLFVRTFEGFVQFSALNPDPPVDVTDQQYTVSSSIAVRDFGVAFQALFREQVNRQLGDLTGTNWALRFFNVKNITYAFTNRAERTDNFEHVALVAIEAITQEAKT